MSRSQLTREQIEELRRWAEEFGSGEGIPDVTPEGIALWNRTHGPDKQLDDEGRPLKANND